MTIQKIHNRSIVLLFLILLLLSCTKRDELRELTAKINMPPKDQNIRTGESIYFDGMGSGGSPASKCFGSLGDAEIQKV